MLLPALTWLFIWLPALTFLTASMYSHRRDAEDTTDPRVLIAAQRDISARKVELAVFTAICTGVTLIFPVSSIATL